MEDHAKWLEHQIKIDLSNRVVHIKEYPSSYSDFEFSFIVDHLYSLSDAYPFALFGRSAAVGTILFCGFNERFRTCSIIRTVSVPCLVVQDPIAPWFTGSRICGGFQEISALTHRFLPSVERWLLVGQSSGGYAAIVCSRIVNSSIVLAFAPQTFNDEVLKSSNIHFPNEFNPSKTMSSQSHIIDLRNLLLSTPPSEKNHIFIIAAFSEQLNPPSEWLWVDAMHWGRVVDCPGVDVFISRSQRHPILLHRVKVFSCLLNDMIVNIDAEHEKICSIINDSVFSE